MPAGEEVERLARERDDADRRYNDALTALDRAVVAMSGQQDLTRADFDRLATALIVFLQQITAFVETKDRDVAARAAAQLNAIERALEPVDELRTQINVLQRALRSVQSSASNAPAPATISPLPSSVDDYKYVAFEDEFRGSGKAIAARLRGYLPLFAGASDVVDLGCGRGEFLAALGAAGVSARGVDTNADMIAICRDRGLAAVHGDALTFVESFADESLGGAIATQVVEHLEPSYLLRLVDALSRKLRPGAPVVLETINAACWLAFFSSYIRDFTHVRPIHPDTLQYLLRASGFERVTIQYSAPVPDHMKMTTVDLGPHILNATDSASLALGRVAHALNANAVILNNLLFTSMDFAAIGYKA